jgi:hypothetical protein
MKDGLQVAVKLGALQSLFIEIVLEGGVVQLLGYLLESLLAVNQAFNQGLQRLFYYLQSCGWV